MDPAPSALTNYLQSQPTHWYDKISQIKSGRIGMGIVIANEIAMAVNVVAIAVIGTNLALYGSLVIASCYTAGVLAGLTITIVLPSMALFGTKNYFKYLVNLPLMGIGNFLNDTCKGTTIDENGGWKKENWIGRIFGDLAHFHDEQLSEALCSFFSYLNKNRSEDNPLSIADLGCGTGSYLAELIKSDITNCHGYELDSAPRELVKLENGKQYYTVGPEGNLTTPDFMEDKEPVSWVLSLEVGEHIPKTYTKTTIQTTTEPEAPKDIIDVTATTKEIQEEVVQAEENYLNNVMAMAQEGIIISWAKKDQPGLGHVNTKSDEEIKELIQKFNQKGWELHEGLQQRLRQHTSPLCFWFNETILVFERKNAITTEETSKQEE